MSNPNPSRISDPMWRFWVEFDAHEPVAKLGGIYANKLGYHRDRASNPSGDYSEQLADDRLGPSDKSSAWDLTLPPAQMKLYSKRLWDACKNRDPRLFKDGRPIIREWIGTLDGKTVHCWVLTGGRALGVGADSGSDPGRDSSHLWHIHISLIRRFINDWAAISQILSILKGEDELSEQVVVKGLNAPQNWVSAGIGRWAKEHGWSNVSQRALTEYSWAGINGLTERLDALTKLVQGESAESVIAEIRTQGEQTRAAMAVLKSEVLAALPEGEGPISREDLMAALTAVLGSVDE